MFLNRFSSEIQIKCMWIYNFGTNEIDSNFLKKISTQHITFSSAPFSFSKDGTALPSTQFKSICLNIIVQTCAELELFYFFLVWKLFSFINVCNKQLCNKISKEFLMFSFRKRKKLDLFKLSVVLHSISEFQRFLKIF